MDKAAEFATDSTTVQSLSEQYLGLRIDHYDDNYLTLSPIRAANKERTSLTDSGLDFHHLVGPLQEQYSDQIFAIGGPR